MQRWRSRPSAPRATPRESADVEILCLDASRPLEPSERTELSSSPSQARIVAFLKSDQPRGTDLPDEAILLSSVTGNGLLALRERLRTAALACRHAEHDYVAATAARCHDSLRAAADGLEQARRLVVERAGEELVALELRSALTALGQVVGAVYTDDVLDRVFSRFCIGK